MNRNKSRSRRYPARKITRAERALFDREFEQVLHALPEAARELLNTIPVAVDDYPSKEVQTGMKVKRDELFGLYTGTPPVEGSFDHAGAQGDVIYIYRLALLLDATTRAGDIDRDQLRHQIRVTLLHELGHYHGFDEDQLDRLGY